MARWAVFDVDGTLLPGTSMERLFSRYLLRKRPGFFKNLAYFLVQGVAAFFSSGYEGMVKSNKSYIRGLSIQAVDEYAEACFQERISPVLASEGKKKVESLREAGHKIMIVSGSPVFLASRLEPEYHPDLLVSTALEVREGYYTGRIAGLHPYGQRKRIILESVGKELHIDFSDSVVFADHRSDIDHMQLFGQAVAVNPKRKLRKHANKQGWEIVFWK